MLEPLWARALSSLEVDRRVTTGAMASGGAQGSHDCAAYAGWQA